jgi:hypothetical protein
MRSASVNLRRSSSTFAKSSMADLRVRGTEVGANVRRVLIDRSRLRLPCQPMRGRVARVRICLSPDVECRGGVERPRSPTPCQGGAGSPPTPGAANNRRRVRTASAVSAGRRSDIGLRRRSPTPTLRLGNEAVGRADRQAADGCRARASSIAADRRPPTRRRAGSAAAARTCDPCRRSSARDFEIPQVARSRISPRSAPVNRRRRHGSPSRYSRNDPA